VALACAKAALANYCLNFIQNFNFFKIKVIGHFAIKKITCHKFEKMIFDTPFLRRIFFVQSASVGAMHKLSRENKTGCTSTPTLCTCQAVK